MRRELDAVLVNLNEKKLGFDKKSAIAVLLRDKKTPIKQLSEKIKKELKFYPKLIDEFIKVRKKK